PPSTIACATPEQSGCRRSAARIAGARTASSVESPTRRAESRGEPARYIARLMAYEHRTVEPKWQARWREAGLHKTPTDPAKPKFYALDMFPYPSGSGLHVGHCEGYTATDVITRWKRMQGFRVLHPMGW